MEIHPQVDKDLSNGFELSEYPEVFIPKTDFTKIGQWYHNMPTDFATSVPMAHWGNSHWSFRLYFSSIN